MLELLLDKKSKLFTTPYHFIRGHQLQLEINFEIGKTYSRQSLQNQMCISVEQIYKLHSMTLWIHSLVK